MRKAFDGVSSVSFLVCISFIAAGCLFCSSRSGEAQVKTDHPELNRRAVARNYGRLPLSFELNQGQADSRARFLARGNGYSLFLTGSSAVLALRTPNPAAGKPVPLGVPEPAVSLKTDVIRMELAGANRGVRVTGAEQLPGTASYFIGNDPARWRRAVPTYGKVRYSEVYPGVDLVYHGNQGRLEYDFEVAPKTDTKSIRLHFAGARRIKLEASGDLQIIAKNGEITFDKPVVYQEIGGQRRPVEGRFALLTKNIVGFRLGSYERDKPVVIDPTLTYSTYLGGSGGGYGTAIAADAAGNAYVVGVTYSTDFPVTGGAFQSTNKSGASYLFNAFVSKLNPTGTSLIYSTYLGGSGNISAAGTFNHGDYPTGISIDSSGNAYVTGLAYSTDFPATSGAFQTTNKGAANGVANGFGTKLNASGTALVYSTYLGGSGLTGYLGNAALGNTGGDGCNHIFVDGSQNAYLTGTASSTDFPVTSGAFQTTNKSAANAGNAFVTKLNASGSTLVYSTYLGGSKADGGSGIAVDGAGDAYVAGATGSTDFPVTSGAFQTQNHAAASGFSNGFITEFNATGSALIYSTYLGGTGNVNGPADNNNGDAIESLVLDSADNAYVAGLTSSGDFPVTSGAFQSTNKGFAANGPPTLFVSKLNASGTALTYSTYLGSSGGDFNAGSAGLALDAGGDVYLTGYTLGTDFPVTADAFQSVNHCPAPGGTNAFVTELNPSGSNLVYSTYLGGSGYPGSGCEDLGYGIALDGTGNAYVTGDAKSVDFPITPGTYQTSKTALNAAFITKFGLGSSATGGTITTLTASANPQSAGVVWSRSQLTCNQPRVAECQPARSPSASMRVQATPCRLTARATLAMRPARSPPGRTRPRPATLAIQLTLRAAAA